MKIDINFRVILILVLLCVFYKVRIYFIFLNSILIHELAHLLFGIFMGLKLKMVSINPFGFKLEFYDFKKNNKILKKIFLNFIGPFSNVILALIFSFFNIEYGLKIDIVYTNIALAVFNLLPIMPLDGGKILKEFLILMFGFKTANVYSVNISKFFLVFISLAYSILIFEVKNIFVFFIIIYLWYLHLIEERKLRTVLRVYKILEGVK